MPNSSSERNPGQCILIRVVVPARHSSFLDGLPVNEESAIIAVRRHPGAPGLFWKFISGTGYLEHWRGISGIRDHFVSINRRGGHERHASYWFHLGILSAAQELGDAIPLYDPSAEPLADWERELLYDSFGDYVA